MNENEKNSKLRVFFLAGAIDRNEKLRKKNKKKNFTKISIKKYQKLNKEQKKLTDDRPTDQRTNQPT